MCTPVEQNSPPSSSFLPFSILVRASSCAQNSTATKDVDTWHQGLSLARINDTSGSVVSARAERSVIVRLCKCADGERGGAHAASAPHKTVNCFGASMFSRKSERAIAQELTVVTAQMRLRRVLLANASDRGSQPRNVVCAKAVQAHARTSLWIRTAAAPFHLVKAVLQ
eukprot:6211372-Pleurochrysis_carterae.AAC.1